MKKKRLLTPANKKYIAQLQGWKCVDCKNNLPSRYNIILFFPNSNKNRFEVDHIIPVSESGLDTFDNLQALCPNCHSKKTERDRIMSNHSFENQNYDDDDVDDDLFEINHSNYFKKSKNRLDHLNSINYNEVETSNQFFEDENLLKDFQNNLDSNQEIIQFQVTSKNTSFENNKENFLNKIPTSKSSRLLETSPYFLASREPFKLSETQRDYVKTQKNRLSLSRKRNKIIC